jgi:hypothetical protein
MRHGGKPKLAQQPTHHVGRARTRKNCAERKRGVVVRLDSRLILFDANERLKGGCMKYRAQIISFPVAPGGLGLHTC